jgi:hypothetical protein
VVSAPTAAAEAAAPAAKTTAPAAKTTAPAAKTTATATTATATTAKVAPRLRCQWGTHSTDQQGGTESEAGGLEHPDDHGPDPRMFCNS